MSEQITFATSDFASNPEPRCPCILLLDVSGSMNGRPINELNAGLVTFRDELLADPLALKRVELGIVTFGPVHVEQPFTSAANFFPPILFAQGDTPMGAAITKALDMVEERKREYRANGISYYRPWIFLITDGAPTDEWQAAANKVSALSLLLCGLQAEPRYIILVPVLAAIWIIGSLTSKAYKAEIQQRREAFNRAKMDYDHLVSQIQQLGGLEGFIAKRTMLEKMKDEMLGLPEEEKRALAALHDTARERQKQKFLEGFFIDVASIPGVGPARKAALRSFGIETAADVTRRGVKQVKGFGDHLTQAVIDWKASCERRFVFRPNEAVTPADRQAVMAKVAAKRHRLESALTVGATELQRFRLHAPARTMPLMEPLRQAAEKLAQAQADLSRC